MQTRRKFIQQSAAASAALITASLVPDNAAAAGRASEFTILHTNDVHSRLEPFPMDGSKNQGLGGGSS